MGKGSPLTALSATDAKTISVQVTNINLRSKGFPGMALDRPRPGCTSRLHNNASQHRIINFQTGKSFTTFVGFIFDPVFLLV